MSLIRSTNTKPELIVRKILNSLGFRFRLHSQKLPGKPDIVLKKNKAVIFVHGCFWHKHARCKRSNMPKSNRKYWKQKLTNNVIRDRKHKYQLRKEGWKVITIWECEVKKPDKIAKRINSLLS